MYSSRHTGRCGRGPSYLVKNTGSAGGYVYVAGWRRKSIGLSMNYTDGLHSSRGAGPPDPRTTLGGGSSPIVKGRGTERAGFRGGLATAPISFTQASHFKNGLGSPIHTCLTFRHMFVVRVFCGRVVVDPDFLRDRPDASFPALGSRFRAPGMGFGGGLVSRRNTITSS